VQQLLYRHVDQKFIPSTLDLADYLPQKLELSKDTFLELKELSKGPSELSFNHSIYFDLDGDVKGFVVSDFSTKLITNQHEIYSLKSIFVESINIMLGNILTKIDQDKNLLISLSTPITKINLPKTNYYKVISAIYTLIHNELSFPININFHTRNNKTQGILDDRNN
jgi:hypothetical protein